MKMSVYLSAAWFSEAAVNHQPQLSTVNCQLSTILTALKAEFDRFTQQDATFIFVTNEIGSGGVSDNAVQRKFTDLQGWMNQYVAQHADEVTLMVCGIPVKIK